MSETNYEHFFGTPEKLVKWSIDSISCPLHMANSGIYGRFLWTCCDCDHYDECHTASDEQRKKWVLEWLEGDYES